MSFFELSFVLLVEGLTVFFLCHGVVSFVLLRGQGSRFLEPGIEFFTKSLSDFWLFSSEVVLLTDVLAELVELIVTVLVIVDEFPVALADDGGGLTSLGCRSAGSARTERDRRSCYLSKEERG